MIYFNYTISRDDIVFQPHRLYFTYSSRLILARKLVEGGGHTPNN
jgi:hypothetical protein